MTTVVVHHKNGTEKEYNCRFFVTQKELIIYELGADNIERTRYKLKDLVKKTAKKGKSKGKKVLFYAEFKAKKSD